jgi:hypothetical protein
VNIIDFLVESTDSGVPISISNVTWGFASQGNWNPTTQRLSDITWTGSIVPQYPTPINDNNVQGPSLQDSVNYGVQNRDYMTWLGLGLAAVYGFYPPSTGLYTTTTMVNGAVNNALTFTDDDGVDDPYTLFPVIAPINPPVIAPINPDDTTSHHTNVYSLALDHMTGSDNYHSVTNLYDPDALILNRRHRLLS